jgi:hypothetical protein
VLEVLGAESGWRFYLAYLWPPDGGNGAPTGRWVAVGEGVSSPLPPADWPKLEFDDWGWPRRELPVMGSSRRSPASLVCLRGKFGVTDPARVRAMKLKIVYWGAPKFHLNGAPLAEGRLAPRPLAAHPNAPAVKDAAQPLQEAIFDLLPQALRRGINVLALEVSQPPTTGGGPEKNIGFFEGSLSAPLGSAVIPNRPPPGGVQAWSTDPTARPGEMPYADPFEPLIVRMRAPCNGFGSGLVVLCSPMDFRGVAATPGALKCSDGSVLPASAVRVRFIQISEDYMPLLAAPSTAPEAQRPPFRPKRGETRPLQGPRFLPLWLTVNVPADAKPGKYSGVLDIKGLTRPVSAALELSVYGWKIGRPREWKTAVNLLQSPESVAGHYKVPLWSERHFQLIEKSFALMAEAGNDVLGVSAVGKTVFGNDPLILAKKSGGGYVPELRHLERYLTLYNKHCGEPVFLSVQVWHYGMSTRGFGRDGGKAQSVADTIPLVEIQSDRLTPLDYPMYGRPGTEEYWKQALDGVYGIAGKLGWRRECVLLGTGGDNWPDPSIVEFFKKVAPQARWRVITHGNGCPKWGATPEERTQPNGMVVDYLEYARRIATFRMKPKGCIISGNSRDQVGGNPFCHWSLPGCNVFPANFQGFAWKGLDYWAYPMADGAFRSALNTYVGFGNVVGGTPRTMAKPGPDGAVATVQFECLREGTQDCEALLYIREAVEQHRAKLGPDLAARAKAAIDALCAHLEIGLRTGPQGGGDLFRLSCQVHSVAAEIAAALGRE